MGRIYAVFGDRQEKQILDNRDICLFRSVCSRYVADKGLNEGNDGNEVAAKGLQRGNTLPQNCFKAGGIHI